MSWNDLFFISKPNLFVAPLKWFNDRIRPLLKIRNKLPYFLLLRWERIFLRKIKMHKKWSRVRIDDKKVKNSTNISRIRNSFDFCESSFFIYIWFFSLLNSSHKTWGTIQKTSQQQQKKNSVAFAVKIYLSIENSCKST